MATGNQVVVPWLVDFQLRFAGSPPCCCSPLDEEEQARDRERMAREGGSTASAWPSHVEALASMDAMRWLGPNPVGHDVY
jgi:hypothetical protein